MGLIVREEVQFIAVMQVQQDKEVLIVEYHLVEGQVQENKGGNYEY